jgi:UDP-N-acetylglucosamine--N-acetylmuramyl-(pentapeptide) pyrophosphoryl-undecaprenol N-acetylglucosamine transferase
MVARVCLVSGGTGGHLMPALVLARALRERGHSALLVTEGREVEKEFLDREASGVEAASLPEGKPSKLRLPMWLLKATLRARRMLKERNVDSVVSTGGRASLPVALAARSLGKPVFLLEQNAIAGRVNRWMMPFAERMYLGLPGPDVTSRACFTGTPLRPEIYRIDRQKARAALGLDPKLPVVLVTGGSQGAQRLNEVAPEAISSLRTRVQVLHLCGTGAVKSGRDVEMRRRYSAADCVATAIVRPIAMDMDTMLGAADLVICRGGGTTVAELMAAGRPAVVVPYPHHKDQQQLKNARVLADAGAAVILEERDLDAAKMTVAIDSILSDRDRLKAMGEAARTLCSVDPTAAILADMQQHGGLR